MVQRNSEAVSFNVGKVQSQGSDLRDVAPDPEKFRKNQDGAALDFDDGSASRMLSTALAYTADYVRQELPRMQEEAYLEGAAKAGIVNSEEEIEGNIFTRGWAVGGYRDTMGRLAQAQHLSKLEEDLKTWREKPPEEFEQYVSERRAKLVPQLEGMTTPARRAAFQNLLLNDQAAIKAHQKEHSKFQMEVMDASINAELRASITNLGAESDDQGSYQISTLAAYSTLVGVTAQNPKLNRTLKGKYVKKAAEYALANDHVDLYNQIMQTELELPEGGTGTLSQYLDWDDEVALGKNFNESQKRTEAVRAMRWVDDKANMQADWDNPDTPVQPLEQVRQHAEAGIRRGFLSADQYGSFMNDYYRAAAKKSENSPLAAAYAANDVGTIHSLDKTPEEAMAAWKSVIGKRLSPTEAMNSLLTMGATQGKAEALREAGKMLTPALMQLGADGTINPDNAAHVASVIQKLDAFEANGKTGLATAFMSSMDEEQRNKLVTIREGLRKGYTKEVAISEAQNRSIAEAKLTKPQREALAAGNAKDDVAVMTELEPRGLLTTLGLGIQSLWSPDAAAELALRPKTDWFGSQERVNEAAAAAKVAVAEELRILSSSNPYMGVEARKSAALAAVSGRTIETKDGPFILPKGMTPERFFGTTASTPKDRIGSAISEYLKPTTEGGRMQYNVTTQGGGQLQFKEYNKKSELVRSGIVDPREVAKLVNAQQDRMAAQYNKFSGTGATVQNVTFNGENSAGLDSRVMFSIRQNLIKHEGYRDTPYKDSSGSKHQDGRPVMTVGAGISSTNEFYPKAGPDGKVSKADTDRAFMLASNAAAKQATAFMQRQGFNNAASTQLFTELFYQSGPGMASVGLPLAKAMKSGNMVEAVKALHSTPAYKMAHAERKKHYDGILFPAMKGQ